MLIMLCGCVRISVEWSKGPERSQAIRILKAYNGPEQVYDPLDMKIMVDAGLLEDEDRPY